MGTLQIAHYLAVAIVAIGVAVPAGRILKKIGYPAAWALLLFVPVLNLIGLWALACAKWPERRGE
jgi:hypothetical protein